MKRLWKATTAVRWVLFLFLLAGSWAGTGSSLRAAPQTDLPPVKWPNGVSSFGKMVLNSCFKNCFNILKHKQSPTPGMFGGMPQTSAIATNCYSRCWNSPFRKRMCKIKKTQLLKQSDQVLHRFQGEWNREQKRLSREKKYIRLILQSERLRQKQLKRERKLRQQQLLAQQTKFKQEKQRLKEVQAELKEARREAIRKRNNTTALKKIKQEQKRLALARKLYLEEQKRLALARKLARERKQKAAKRKQEFQRWVQKTKKLREQSKQQLAQLKQQALQEKQQLGELRKLKEQNEKLLQQQQALELQREKARKQRLHREVTRLAARKARLKKAMMALKRRRARVRRRRARARRVRRRRIRRLATLRKQRTKHRHQWKVRRQKKRDYRYYFRKGNLNKAQELSFGRDNKRVMEFMRMYFDGQAAYTKRSANRALPKLERALTLELQICKGRSTYHHELRKMLGEMYVLKGIQSFSSQNFPTSYLYFSRSLRHTPRSEAARSNIKKLGRIAAHLYDKALRNKGNRQIFLRLLRKALGCVPSRSKLAKRIRKHLS